MCQLHGASIELINPQRKFQIQIIRKREIKQVYASITTARQELHNSIYIKFYYNRQIKERGSNTNLLFNYHFSSYPVTSDNALLVARIS